MNEIIKIEKKGMTGTIIMAHGPMNILNTDMLQKLREALDGLEKDDTVRVAVLTGDRNFSAGADIREMRSKTPEEALAFSRLGHSVCGFIEKMGKPVIAAVRGHALGGGFEIALACDMRIADEGAKFGLPELDLGLIPGFGGTQRLPLLIGAAKAKELIFTGRTVEAKEAERLGLLTGVSKDGELMKDAEETAFVLAGKNPMTIRSVKRLINEGLRSGGGFEKEPIFFSQCFSSEDHLEGINAFLEKRKPIFKGR